MPVVECCTSHVKYATPPPSDCSPVLGLVGREVPVEPRRRWQAVRGEERLAPAERRTALRPGLARGAAREEEARDEGGAGDPVRLGVVRSRGPGRDRGLRLAAAAAAAGVTTGTGGAGTGTSTTGGSWRATLFLHFECGDLVDEVFEALDQRTAFAVGRSVSNRQNE